MERFAEWSHYRIMAQTWLSLEVPDDERGETDIAHGLVFVGVNPERNSQALRTSFRSWQRGRTVS